VDGELLAGLEIEIEDLEMGGVVDEQPAQRFLFEAVLLEHTDPLHDRISQREQRWRGGV
jgi:hypothetical protein